MNHSFARTMSWVFRGAFGRAFDRLVKRLGAAAAVVPMAIFIGRQPFFLKRADQGLVQVIYKGRRRYVLLTECQLIELLSGSRRHCARLGSSALAANGLTDDRVASASVLPDR